MISFVAGVGWEKEVAFDVSLVLLCDGSARLRYLCKSSHQRRWNLASNDVIMSYQKSNVEILRVTSTYQGA